MDESNSGGVRDARRRRQRINRMKTTIVATIAIWMLVSMIVCVALTVKVVGLNHKINRILDYYEEQLKSSSVTMDDTDVSGKNEGNSEEVFAPGEPEEYDTDTKTQYTDAEGNRYVTGEQQKVYLTFDDGPSDNTDEILDVLAEYQVKATFFVVGKTDEHSKAMYRRIVEEGHTLALHSYSHKYSSIYQSLDAYKKDLTKLSDLLYDVTGVRPKYVRFPGGSSNRVSNVDMREFIKYVTDEGYKYFDWNVVSGDATNQAYTSEDLVDNVMSGIANYQTSIVLMHDATNKTSTVEALRTVIEQLQGMGVELLPIDDNTKEIHHMELNSEKN